MGAFFPLSDFLRDPLRAQGGSAQPSGTSAKGSGGRGGDTPSVGEEEVYSWLVDGSETKCPAGMTQRWGS